jgi:hypothetical protein
VLAPIFKLCFGSSEPFVGASTWATSALQLAGDRRDVPVLLSQLLSATA